MRCGGALPDNQAHRLASLIDKLNRAYGPILKTHTLVDELRILHQRLPQDSQRYSHWRTRIERVLSACDALAFALPIHLASIAAYRAIRRRAMAIASG